MIYLDYNATTPVLPRIYDAMQPYFSEFFGNPSSRTHLYGWDAREAVDKARKQVAQLLGITTRELVFTSGATESVNLAIKGLYDQQFHTGKNHIITVSTEHKAVLDVCHYLEKYRGASLTLLEVDEQGQLDLDALESAITPRTLLVSVMLANNETGGIHPLKKIGAVCRRSGVVLFSDATQAIGKIPVHPKELGVQLMAFSGHKMYAPKGVGGLFIDEELKIVEQQNGGGHERNRRSGTLHVPGIVGLGEAAVLAGEHPGIYAGRIAALRDELEQRLMDELPGVSVHSRQIERLPHVSNIHFEGVEAEALMLALSTHVALSAGSACNSASILPSHVLTSMGASEEEALSSIRFSLGIPTTPEEIESALQKLIPAVRHLRG